MALAKNNRQKEMLLLNRYKGQHYDVKNPSLHIIQKEIYFCIELHKDKLRTFKKEKKTELLLLLRSTFYWTRNAETRQDV